VVLFFCCWGLVGGGGGGRAPRPDCMREEMRTYNINKEKITVKEMSYHDLIYKTLERP